MLIVVCRSSNTHGPSTPLERRGGPLPKRSASQHVPKDLQVRFEEITQFTDAFCQTYLDEEYVQLSRELTATLCRKRPSPLARGKAPRLSPVGSSIRWAWLTCSSMPPRCPTVRPA